MFVKMKAKRNVAISLREMNSVLERRALDPDEDYSLAGGKYRPTASSISLFGGVFD
jgi:hypothetical protein